MGEVHDDNLVTMKNNISLDNTLFSNTMKNPLDPDEFKRQGHLMIDFLADYYQNIEKFPVRSQVKPGFLRNAVPESAPYNPEPIERILHDVEKDIMPGITHWQSPNFFAYFQSNASTANFLGEMLCTGFNTVGFSWIASPSATELESIVMDWLGKMLDLPEPFLFSKGGGGVIQGTTCEAFLCTIIAAKKKMLGLVGRRNIDKLVVYCSDQTHFSLQKAARIAGINPCNIRALKTKKSEDFQLSPVTLKSSILSDINDGLIPLYLCATVGTTPTGSVDPLGPLSEVAKEHNIWVHVDAAYAGSAAICPEFRRYLSGVEYSNSFSFNPHKWLLTSLDCCCLWVKQPNDLINALSTNPEILRNNASESKQVVDYKDWQISLSRRFRAFKLWVVIRSHGVGNLRTFIRGHVKLAKHFEELVRKDERFEVVVPRKFGLVCFRMLAPNGEEDDGNELNRKLVEMMNDSGRVFMTHAVIEGMYVIRCAIGATLTDYRHVNMAWKVVQEYADVLLHACIYP